MCYFDGTASSPSSCRLSSTTVPSHYDLKISLAGEKFAGEEDIDIDVREPVEFIQINAIDLVIERATVSNEQGTRLMGTVTCDQVTEIATIAFHGTVGTGKWKLHLEFSGTLGDKLKGFYRSTWRDAGGAVHQIAVTQFEPADARRAFPCFDEPEFKATFKVSLEVDANLTALSNGRGKEILLPSSSDGCQRKMVEFSETPRMSTYLVCFCVGEFVSSRGVKLANGKEVRVWCIPGKENLIGMALRSALWAVPWYEKYFGVPYKGGDKIDLIGIPDFAHGAMENWGLITFRETDLLVDDATASQPELERVATVVLHELAHQWFGNLVTMKWWNGLWLNEAFATFMERKCLDAWMPRWRTWQSFGPARAAAARLDSLQSTHPVETLIKRPSEAEAVFDLISYEKGCALLRMIEQFIGEEVFQHGISIYLKEHEFGSCEGDDLWDALEAACQHFGVQVPVRRIMDTWVYGAGHPVLEVRESSVTGLVDIIQSPFRLLTDNSDQSWPVPVTVRIGSEGGISSQKLVLEEKDHMFYPGEGVSWIVVNAGGDGFYRVRYSDALRAKLNPMNLDLESERFNLANDQWSFVRAGLSSAKDFVTFVKHFATEQSPNIWSILLNGLYHLYSILPEKEKSWMRREVADLLTPALAKLGWDASTAESVQIKQLRSLFIAALGTWCEVLEVQEKAKGVWNKFKSNRSLVDPNIVPAVISVVAYAAEGKDQFEEFYGLYKTASTPQDEHRNLFALAGFRDIDLLKRTIVMTLGEVRTQDAPSLLVALLSNPVCSAETWTFIRDHWDEMVAKYPSNLFMRMIHGLEQLDTLELEADVVKFLETHKVPGTDMAVRQALENLHVNVLLRQKESVALAEHLRSLQTAQAPAGEAALVGADLAPAK